MKRRDFMSSVGVLAGSLPVALAACNSPTATVPSESDPEKVAPESTPDEIATSVEGFAPIGTVTELDANGALLNRPLAKIASWYQ